MDRATDEHSQRERKARDELFWPGSSGATVRRYCQARDRFACAAATVLMEYPMAIMRDMASSA